MIDDKAFSSVKARFEKQIQVLVTKARKIRNNVVHWWGNCSYRRLKVTIEVREMLCPLCQHELVDAVYCGSKEVVTVRKSFGYVRDCWMPEHEDGLVVWVVSDSHKRY